MSLVSDTDILDYLGVTQDHFAITASNDVIVLKYDAGVSTNVEVADGTYTGSELATALKTAIDTAFTIASTVSWSSTTRLFGINVSGGHTIQYIHSGSDMGPTIGFTANSLAEVSISSDTACGDPTSEALFFRDAIESLISKYCRRTLESATYSLERYDGTGTKQLQLKAYPVTSLYRLSIGVDEALRIKNTNDNSSASISVNSTGIVLEVDSVVDSTCTFAAYTTINTISAAITALGNGWSSEVVDYSTYKSNLLLPRFGANANDNNYVYLYIPDEAEDEFEVNENTGTIYHPVGFPKGHKNIYVSYSGGYTSTTLPDDLKQTILSCVNYNYNKFKDNMQNIERYTIGDIEYWFSKESQKTAWLPNESKSVLGFYRRVMV